MHNHTKIIKKFEGGKEETRSKLRGFPIECRLEKRNG